MLNYKIKFTFTVFFILATAPCFAAELPAIGKVIEANGHAESLTRHTELKAGTAVFDGERVSTQNDSMVRILLDDAIAIQIGANTELKIEHPKNQKTAIELISGNILSSVRALVGKKAAARYEVRTRDAVMGVRGTTFFVQAQDKKRTFLCICNGTVAVNWQGKETLITSKHHDAPKYLDHEKGIYTAAKVGSDHRDADSEILKNLLNKL